MRWIVMFVLLGLSGCAYFDGPVVLPPPFTGQPTGADTGSVR